jgi:LysR family transcriptional regulator, glycine cleavage system transcriptional activator
LGSLRVFIAVADHLSFTRAADALGVTASAASLQIRSLEEYLARPLFRRNGRQVLLTAEGAALLPRVREGLGQLERAVDDARRDRSVGPLRVSTLASFLQQWMLPRLERFRVAHPEIDLHLHTSDALVDFVREDFHAAVRFGLGGWANLHSERLLDEWVVPVCAPALYRKFGALHDADDLRRYPLLHSVSEPWTMWLFDGRSTLEASGLRGAVFDASVAVVRMAIQGAGLVLARWSLVADEIAAGLLVRASARAVALEEGYWLACPARARALPAVKAFMDWIRAEAAAFAPPTADRTAVVTSPKAGRVVS